jgi:hypothetical protein
MLIMSANLYTGTFSNYLVTWQDVYKMQYKVTFMHTLRLVQYM